MDDALNLSDLLVFNQDKGRISLWEYRMVLFSARAWSCLRRELTETLGHEEARCVLKRFGYEAGAADAQALMEQLPFLDENKPEMLKTLLAFSGFSALKPAADQDHKDNDLSELEGCWLHSCESGAERMERNAKEPVCWFLAGYMMGCMTAITRQPMLVVETECRAMGHDHCKFIAGQEDKLPAWFAKELADYQPANIQERFKDLEYQLQLHRESLDEQNDLLESRERTILALNEAMETNFLIDLQPEETENTQKCDIPGHSRAVERMMESARLIAPAERPVLLYGEPGCGKTRLSTFIHEESTRARGPFKTLHCGLLPRGLQESELFGYGRGAFPGAFKERAGLLESCHGGTLFLSEVDTLGLETQSRLCEYLSSGQLTRMGEDEIREVDVRLIFGTSVALKEQVQQGRFLESFYYMLEDITIAVPPLRNRDNDILRLAGMFLKEFAEKNEKAVTEMTASARRVIARYSWPGNIRELRNAIEHAVLIAEGDTIKQEDLPPGLLAEAAEPENNRKRMGHIRPNEAEQLARMREEVMSIPNERKRLEKVLNMVGGHRERAARVLGWGRTTLWRRMNRWGLE